MTRAEAFLSLVEELPGRLAEALIGQLRNGAAPVLPNPVYQSKVEEFLRRWVERPDEAAGMLEVALAARRARPGVELVWTGPETTVVPVRRTEQVLLEMIREAERRLSVTSFGVFQIPRVVQELEKALERGVALRLVLGEQEGDGGQRMEWQRRHLGETVGRRATVLHWAAERRQRDEQGRAGLMHVKAAVADGRVAFLTSANLTEAALERNMELGVLIQGGPAPEAVERLLDALVESGELTGL